MKKIPKPELKNATRLSPMEMNRIHFGGTHSPVATGATTSKSQ